MRQSQETEKSEARREVVMASTTLAEALRAIDLRLPEGRTLSLAT